MRLWQLALFAVAISLVVFGLHHFLWARLFRDPLWPAPWTRGGAVLLMSLGLAIPVTMVFSRALPRAIVTPFAWIVFVWMGTAFLLFSLLLLGELAGVALSAAGMLRDPARRQFFARAVALGAGGVGLLASALAVHTALARLVVRTVRVPLAKLHPSMEGFTVVQLTDIHVGPTIDRAFIEAMVAQVNELDADVVVITGDLVDGSVDALGHHVAPIAGLRAKHGVFFVTGNHEYYSGVDAWIAEVQRHGVRVLRNEHVTVGEGDARIDLAGVDDWSAHRFGHGHGADLPRALAGRDTSREVILLAHQPKAVAEAASLGVGLVLSGHTHGGQIWPFSYLVALDQPIVGGLHRVKDTWAYVSEGTGYWGPPMRLRTHGEITRVVLSRG